MLTTLYHIYSVALDMGIGSKYHMLYPVDILWYAKCMHVSGQALPCTARLRVSHLPS